MYVNKQIRLANWDYRSSAAYFITICTQDRTHYFGKITDGKMNLSQLGVLADVFWHEIKNHAKDIELGEFVVMPNHIHGILILKDSSSPVDSGSAPVGLGHALNQQVLTKDFRFQNIGKNSVSSIIGSYKSAVSKHAHRLGYEFHWQRRFHDHIIRDDRAFRNISEYIRKNPEKSERRKR
jgi:putative transposase